MNEHLLRAVRFFVDTEIAAAGGPEPRFAPPVPSTRGPDRVPGQADAQDGIVAAVLATRSDIDVVAGATAAGVRQRGTPVICVWDPGRIPPPAPVAEAPPRPALPAAARLARRLGDRGFIATAYGAAVSVALSDEAVVALSEVRRLEAAAPGPLIVALARRHPGLDTILREAARLVVAVAPDAVSGVAELVFDEARALNRSSVGVTAPTAFLARAGCRLALRSPEWA